MEYVPNKHVDFPRKKIPTPEILKLQPLISRLLGKVGQSELVNPFGFMEYAFDLFAEDPVKIEKIKWEPSSDDLSSKFCRMLDKLENGRSSISETHALEILQTYNHFTADIRETSIPGGDADWHFQISSSDARKGRLLYIAVQTFRPRSVLEIGTAYGMSATFMMLAMERFGSLGHFSTIEQSEPQYSMAKAVLTDRFNDHVNCVQGYSEDCLPTVCKSAPEFGMVFHDGGHSRDCYIGDFKNMVDHLQEGAIVIIDDIRWFDPRFVDEDPGCYEGWREIVADERVRLAVDVDDSMGIALIGPRTAT